MCSDKSLTFGRAALPNCCRGIGSNRICEPPPDPSPQRRGTQRRLTSERQIAEFVENEEVHSRELIGDPTLPSVTGLGLEPVDEIDHVVEPATGAGADAASGDGDGQMGLAGTGPADQHGVALLGDEVSAGEIVDERLVDGRALELEVVEVLRQWQLGDSELVLDRT